MSSSIHSRLQMIFCLVFRIVEADALGLVPIQGLVLIQVGSVEGRGLAHWSGEGKSKEKCYLV